MARVTRRAGCARGLGNTRRRVRPWVSSPWTPCERRSTCWLPVRRKSPRCPMSCCCSRRYGRGRQKIVSKSAPAALQAARAGRSGRAAGAAARAAAGVNQEPGHAACDDTRSATSCLGRAPLCDARTHEHRPGARRPVFICARAQARSAQRQPRSVVVSRGGATRADCARALHQQRPRASQPAARARRQRRRRRRRRRLERQARACATQRRGRQPSEAAPRDPPRRVVAAAAAAAIQRLVQARARRRGDARRARAPALRVAARG